MERGLTLFLNKSLVLRGSLTSLKLNLEGVKNHALRDLLVNHGMKCEKYIIYKSTTTKCLFLKKHKHDMEVCLTIL